MEVESLALSSFDVDPKLPFSYSGDRSKLHLLERPNLGGFESESGESKKSDDADAAANCSTLDGGNECEKSEGEFDPLKESSHSSAAKTLQKVYRSYRTRRLLADSAVVVEELWWQAIDYARLNHSTISFFNFLKPETVASRWNRVTLNASKVGKGLSKDAKAQKLAFQHWIEAIDPRHRYGHSLHKYYEQWCKADAGQPFFYWLDVGGGKEVDLEECPRSKLRLQCIKYLGPQEREHYEYTVTEGRIVHKQTGILLDTNKGALGAKWIFVMSTSKRLYSGEKKKGRFHHSSFLAGGATLAAGRLVVENGTLKSISAHSGHYRPTDDRIDSCLEILKENGVVLDKVEIHKANEDYEEFEDSKTTKEAASSDNSASNSESPLLSDDPYSDEREISPELLQPEAKTNNYKRTLSGGLQSPKAEVPRTAIMQRINSKKAMKSYQLGNQLSLKWSTGAGPRIGCIADYPIELRQQALEFTCLSPRTSSKSPACWQNAGISPKVITSPYSYSSTI